MANERVDKGWQTKGLSGYSTAAILGTLGHYGVPLDEEGFRALSAKKYPLALAEEWASAWKGTGQFAKYPLFAADELWSRFEPQKLSPGQFAKAIRALVKALQALLDEVADAPVGAAFAEAKALKERVPLAGGKPEEPFIMETLVHLGEAIRPFNQLAEQLAKAGHTEDAQELAELEEFVFPMLGGTSRALVRAAKGEKDQALVDLEAIASGAEASLETRLSAVDTFLHLEAWPQARAHGEKLLDDALAQQADVHFCLEVGGRLAQLVKRLGPSEERSRLVSKLGRLEALHASAHPDHAH